MIPIKKSREPVELTRYRNTPYATYDGMSGEKIGRTGSDGEELTLKDLVLNRLIKDQGHLCAYCMRKIPEKRGNPVASIEHIDPQSKTDDAKALMYSNMLAVCSGNRGSGDKDATTCDAHRGAQPLTLNPTIRATLTSIDYRCSGRIYSQDAEIDNELDNILNLNCKVRDLVNLRRRALQQFMLTIKEKGWEGNLSRYQQLLQDYQRPSEEKLEYVGILINWLEKKISR